MTDAVVEIKFETEKELVQMDQNNSVKTTYELTAVPENSNTSQFQQPEDMEGTEIYEFIAEEAGQEKFEKVREFFPKEKVEKKMDGNITEIARKQLEALSNFERKSRKQSFTTASSTTTMFPDPSDQITVLVNSEDGVEEWSVPVSETQTAATPEKVVKPTIKQPQTMLLKNSTSLTSNILSKHEVDDVIKKALKQKDDFIGTIEIPQELILSSELASPSRIIITESEPHLESQELIDILEGNDEPKTYGVTEHDSNVILMQAKAEESEKTEIDDYEIVIDEVEHNINKQQHKLIEREIALRQIMNLPKQKMGRKPRDISPTTKTMEKSKSHAQELVDSLVSEWSDDKGDSDEGTSAVTFEIQDSGNGEISIGAPVIQSDTVKILNVEMIKSPEKPKIETADPKKHKKTQEQPKILNKNAPKGKTILNKDVLSKIKSKIPVEPKILNKNAPAEPASFRRQNRIIKKKVIWDPDAPETAISYASLVNTDRKTTASPEITAPKLPQGITVKKVVPKVQKEETIKIRIQNVEQPTEDKKPETPEPPKEIEVKTETESSSEDEIVQEAKPAGRRRKARSEIDKLLSDEGAINMIYSLERENNNTEVPEIEVKPNKKSLINLSKEKNCLLAKAKAIKNVVTKQSTSPNAVAAPAPRVRVKKEKEIEPEPPVKAATKPAQAKKGAGRKRKANDEWDYVYAKCDDAMIIRRRSNSSYDSSAATSPRRLSIDTSNASGTATPQTEKDSFEFIKPSEKNVKSPGEDILTPNLIEAMKGKFQKAFKKTKIEDETTQKKPVSRKRAATSPPETAGSSKIRSKAGEFSNLQVHRFENYVHVVLAPANDGKLKDVLTIDLMNELRTLLGQLKTEANCKVVLVTSAGETFSNGIDFSSLVQNTIADRKQSSSDLLTALKNFLVGLVTFPKILVCGIDGPTKNLGVTMLTLFDAVIANDKATFKTDYGQIGHIPEGMSLMSITGKVRGNCTNSLFYLGDTLTAKNAFDHGLVTKLVSNTEDFVDELYKYCKTTASMSSQFLESTKALMNEDLLDSIETYLSSEVKTLLQQWISPECQEKFKNYLTKEEW